MNPTEELLAEREKTHGKYDRFATYVQRLKEWTTDFEDRGKGRLSPEHREAVDMILHKIGRIVTGDPNVEDHWRDISGYATLGARFVRPRVESQTS